MNLLKYYDNIFNEKNKGARVMDIDKLNVGQKYILFINGQVECGPLIKKTLSNLPEIYAINYYGIYFRIGLAKYDRITLTDQEHHYQLQSHLNLPAMKLKIYEYNLAGNLQEQIKYWRYYKKTINNLCKELNIPDDIERLISKYL